MDARSSIACPVARIEYPRETDKKKTSSSLDQRLPNLAPKRSILSFLPFFAQNVKWDHLSSSYQVDILQLDPPIVLVPPLTWPHPHGDTPDTNHVPTRPKDRVPIHHPDNGVEDHKGNRKARLEEGGGTFRGRLRGSILDGPCSHDDLEYHNQTAQEDPPHGPQFTRG